MAEHRSSSNGNVFWWVAGGLTVVILGFIFLIWKGMDADNTYEPPVVEEQQEQLEGANNQPLYTQADLDTALQNGRAQGREDAEVEEDAADDTEPTVEEEPAATEPEPTASSLPQDFTEVRAGWGYRRDASDCVVATPNGTDQERIDSFYQEWCGEYTANRWTSLEPNRP